MSADTPRQQLAEQFRTDHPGWLVSDFPDVPKQVVKGRPVVSVWRSELVPASNRTNLTHEITINGYGAKTVGAGAEDELDDLLDDLLLSLERFPGFILTRASRQSFAKDSIAGWQITGSVLSPNVYRSTIQSERSSNGTPAP